MEKTVKTGFLRRYGGVPAAVCALKSHHDLYQMSSIFICELKQCKLCIYRNIIEKCMYFYKSAAVTAVGGAGGGAKLILRIVYVVRSIYFNFQPNLTIFTIPMENTVKTGFLRRYGAVTAAVCASKSHHDLYQMSSIFI